MSLFETIKANVPPRHVTPRRLVALCWITDFSWTTFSVVTWNDYQSLKVRAGNFLTRYAFLFAFSLTGYFIASYMHLPPVAGRFLPRVPAFARHSEKLPTSCNTNLWLLLLAPFHWPLIASPWSNLPLLLSSNARRLPAVHEVSSPYFVVPWWAILDSHSYQSEECLFIKRLYSAMTCNFFYDVLRSNQCCRSYGCVWWPASGTYAPQHAAVFASFHLRLSSHIFRTSSLYVTNILRPGASWNNTWVSRLWELLGFFHLNRAACGLDFREGHTHPWCSAAFFLTLRACAICCCTVEAGFMRLCSCTLDACTAHLLLHP